MCLALCCAYTEVSVLTGYNQLIENAKISGNRNIGVYSIMFCKLIHIIYCLTGTNGQTVLATDPTPPLTYSLPTEIVSTVTDATHPTHTHTNKSIYTPTMTIPWSGMELKVRETAISSKKIMIIGATSYLGARTALFFKHQGSTVATIEDSLAVTSNSAMWYQWEQLVSAGLTPQKIDFTDSSKLNDLLGKEKPSVIFYSPSIVLNAPNMDDSSVAGKYSMAFRHLLALLTAVKLFGCNNIEFIFPYISSSDFFVQSSWMSAFEQTLSSYHSTCQLDVSIAKIKGVYGPGKESTGRNCWYVDDIFNGISKYTSMESNSITYILAGCGDRANIPHLTSEAEGESLYDEWLASYHERKQSQNKRVVMSTYFTSQRNPQYAIEFNKDNFRFMQDWFFLLYKANLHMVVFHDTLTSAFTDSIKRNYPRIDFVHVQNFDRRKPNDRRFFLYYNYLISHPDISHLIMTDMRDVKMLSNPFEVIDVLGDLPYVGLDIPFTMGFGQSQRAWKDCLPPYRFDRARYSLWPYFNAGVVGGTRATTLHLLMRVTDNLNFNRNLGCNMPAVYISVHKYFIDDVFFGWPFQFGFTTHQPAMPGNCILHKTTIV